MVEACRGRGGSFRRPAEFLEGSMGQEAFREVLVMVLPGTPRNREHFLSVHARFSPKYEIFAKVREFRRKCQIFAMDFGADFGATLASMFFFPYCFCIFHEFTVWSEMKV